MREMKKIEHLDPEHGKDFPRSDNHCHVSFYVLAKKST
jgi:hypothetical protein